MKLKEWFTCIDSKDALYKGGATLLWLLSGLAVLVIIGALIMLSRGNVADGYENTITVSGEAEIFAVPDTATITFTVSEEMGTIAEAQEGVTKTMNAILQDLQSEGIEEDDVKTQNYSSNPRYEYNRKTGEQVLAGYNVRHSVLVKIRDIKEVGTIVGLLGSYDVDDMYGPNFSIDDPERLQEDVRAEAIEDAKEEAKRLVKELDVRLGKLISYNEGGYAPYMMKSEMAVTNMSMGSVEEDFVVPELPTGEQSITANVTLTYKIK